MCMYMVDFDETNCIWIKLSLNWSIIIELILTVKNHVFTVTLVQLFRIKTISAL